MVPFDLKLVSLLSWEDLAAIGQDTWLTWSPASDYAKTRPWASAIRAWAPWASGLTWRSRREPDGFAYIFFGDRCPQGCFEEVTEGLRLPPGDRSLGTGAARLHIQAILVRYRVTIMSA